MLLSLSPVLLALAATSGSVWCIDGDPGTNAAARILVSYEQVINTILKELGDLCERIPPQ